MLMETGKCDLDSLLESDYIDRIHNSLTEKKDELARTSKTSKLWINYQRMLGIARALVSADRMGSCEMHLSAVSVCLPIFAGPWPSELFEVGSSISPEDVCFERRQS